jgi:hypothetical protein
MRRLCLVLACLTLLSTAALAQSQPRDGFRRLSMGEYLDRMKGGWIGQMAGVSWGAPTEFQWVGKVIPADKMPAWDPEMTNYSYGQDDLYVEMTFLRTLELYGLNASIRQAGIDFANSTYGLACANRSGRENLRKGIAPPDSGHPAFSPNSDDIDYQIEADYSGLIAPGMPNTAIRLGNIYGQLMNYGDGVYGGQLIGGMYAAAFFETDMERIVEAGLACIPAGSQYAETIRDVLSWYREDPNDWERTWGLVTEKYLRNPAYRRFTFMQGEASIDAKLNGAYVVMGMLFGHGDPDQTAIIACRCGQDSDCNPSNAEGVLFTILGASQLPAKFTEKFDTTRSFANTPYSFDRLVEVCRDLARQAVVAEGGWIETDARGAEVLVIPVKAPQPNALARSYEPGPIAGSRFTPEERALITEPDELTRALSLLGPDWTLSDCGPDMGAPALLGEFRGKSNVLIIHPLARGVAAVLSRSVAVPAEGETVLRATVGHYPDGDWELIVKVDGATVLDTPVGAEMAQAGWREVEVDLTPYGGRTVKVEVLNQPTGWAFEAGYFTALTVGAK